MKEVNSTNLEPSAPGRLDPSTSTIGKVAFAGGVLAFVAAAALSSRMSLGADATLTELVSHQYWLPVRVLDIVAFVLVGYAVLQLLRIIHARGMPTLAITAGATLAIGIGLQIAEFAIAALAAPALLETDLTASETALVLEAYRTLGTSLLDVSLVFLGFTLLLVAGGSVRLYVTRGTADTVAGDAN